MCSNRDSTVCYYNWKDPSFQTPGQVRKPFIKGTDTVCFSSSLYIINQKPMINRTHFHYITTWVAHSSG